MEKYFQPHLSAYLRGRIIQGPCPELYRSLTGKLLVELTDQESNDLICYGKEHGINFSNFEGKNDLPHIQYILNVLHKICPADLMDIGSGSGNFMFPFMRDFPNVSVNVVDIHPRYTEMYRNMAIGGMKKLMWWCVDICKWSDTFENHDVVTMLNVLEYVKDIKAAVENAVKMAGRYVIVTISDRTNNSTDFVNILTKDRLTELFTDAGCKNLQFHSIDEYIVMIAEKQ